MGIAGQNPIIEYLADPATHGTDDVRRVTTSISEIFMAGDTVYKLKRAVALPYVDFSDLEKRRAACEREVALNRRTAPQIYQGVVSLTRENDGFAIDGSGEVVDYLVKMRRFDEETLFDHLARSGDLDDSLIIGLADVICNFHRGAEIRPEYGGPEALRQAVHDVIAPVREEANPPVGGQDLDRIETTWTAALGPIAGRLAVRRRRGYVRQCHGDLHLSNICLFEGRPTPFDTIEFNDAIACVDMAYDAAFPVMDLIAHREDGLANLLFNRYLAVSQDYHALPAWPLFLGARAIVRAMVAALSNGDDPAEGRWAETYLALAAECLRPRQPRLIAVGGQSGTGKSTLARRLAPLVDAPPGAVWLRTDIIRKTLAGVTPETRLGPDAYTPQMTAATYRRLLRTGERALRQGWPVILDAAFLKADERDAAAAAARRAGVPFTGLWLETPMADRVARVEARTGDASDADETVVKMQDDVDVGVVNWARVTTRGEIGSTAARAREILGI